MDGSDDGAGGTPLRCAFCLTLNRVDVSRAAERPRCGECRRPFLLDRPLKLAGGDLARLVREADVPVLVDFTAAWCGPCKAMAPVLDRWAAARAGSVLVAKVDTDESPEAAARLDIRGIPTFVLFREGREVGRETGAIPEGRLDALLSGGGPEA